MFDINSVEILTNKISTWYESLIKSIPNVLAALLVIVLFFTLAKITTALVDKVLNRTKINNAVTHLLGTLTFLIVFVLGIFISLEILNLEKAVTSLLAGAGVIGLALGFAFQEIASNFVSGILIAIRQPYKINDIVEVSDYLGKVTNINLRVTTIRRFDGLDVLIPNKTMFTEPLTNYTSTPERRLEINVGVSYGDNLPKVEEILLKEIENTEARLNDRPAEVYYDEFGSSSINLRCFIWIEYPNNQAYLKVKHELIKRIKSAFDKSDITIPFPIRTLDFGIKGGQTLSEMKIHRGQES